MVNRVFYLLRRVVQSGLRGAPAGQRGQSRALQTISLTKSFGGKTWLPASPVLFAFSVFGYSWGSKDKMSEKTVTASGSTEELIPQSDQLFDENKYKDAYEVLLNHPERDSNVEVLWRIARGHYKAAKEMDNKTEKGDTVRKGFEFIQRALELNDTHYAVHKWYAVLLDAKSEQDGMWERVNQLHNVKHHMVRATECNPGDPTSWWILGCFEFGIADMSWYVLKLVQKILKEPPTGTYEKALECFLRAENLQPMFYTTNHLWLGKCYSALKNPEKAKHHLNIAATAPIKNYDDKKCQEEALQLLKKL
ncbi:regulator of microtubule dynamics protein 1-like [Phlebotomus argentipes]|uniref:regulator of microtubule dynamics protein 1-like n=1 Tax=Phlebotomus argentipes TaxID=94469 RepID=UPI0028935124|nr:regulator of microtubule dynamics protein 1-like [Phlebotomus argentipes]XP_059608566.1 regulator of microtubule dynamics protein 1-like [Phlebotomus argentipes]